MDETPRERLAEEMDGRRKKLRLRWNQVAQRAGISVQTLLRIRSGETAVTDFAAEGIEQALDWPTGYIGNVLSDSTSTPDQMDKDEQDHEALKVIHKMNTRLFGLEEADRRLEQDIREINAARDRTRRRSSERPEIA